MGTLQIHSDEPDIGIVGALDVVLDSLGLAIPVIGLDYMNDVRVA